jgi:hypothetical protein
MLTKLNVVLPEPWLGLPGITSVSGTASGTVRVSFYIGTGTLRTSAGLDELAGGLAPLPGAGAGPSAGPGAGVGAGTGMDPVQGHALHAPPAPLAPPPPAPPPAPAPAPAPPAPPAPILPAVIQGPIAPPCHLWIDLPRVFSQEMILSEERSKGQLGRLWERIMRLSEHYSISLRIHSYVQTYHSPTSWKISESPFWEIFQAPPHSLLSW